MVYEVRTYGDGILRAKARKIEAIDEDLLALGRDMIETMHAEEGVGLAAQQIGKDIAICVIDVPDSADKDDQGQRLNPELEMPLVALNPEILSMGRKTNVAEEGCLSFPEIRGNIERALSIRLRFMDTTGKVRELDVHGFTARVFQHEIDHLNGVLFIDKMSTAKRVAIAGKLKRLKRDTEERLAEGHVTRDR
jgi:peptide deformylase